MNDSKVTRLGVLGVDGRQSAGDAIDRHKNRNRILYCTNLYVVDLRRAASMPVKTVRMLLLYFCMSLEPKYYES